jgi:hypothetical protein
VLEAPARIELATLRLGNECSIQLSYGATIHLYKIHERDGRIRRVDAFLSLLSVLADLDWVAIFALVVAVASLWVAVRTLDVARKTVRDAADDWAQRKWFELYQQADYAYDLLDRFRQVHPAAGSTNSGHMASDWNDTMLTIRRAHAMAVVFPVNPTIAKFVSATSVFQNQQNAYNQTIVDAFFDAVQDLRDMATLRPEVLNRQNP